MENGPFCCASQFFSWIFLPSYRLQLGARKMRCCLDIGCCSAPDLAQLFFCYTKLKSLIFNICPTLLYFVQRTCSRDECQLQAAENQPQIAGD